MARLAGVHYKRSIIENMKCEKCGDNTVFVDPVIHVAIERVEVTFICVNYDCKEEWKQFV